MMCVACHIRELFTLWLFDVTSQSTWPRFSILRDLNFDELHDHIGRNGK